jgi:ABC-type multidrug transport system ATPase subunit
MMEIRLQNLSKKFGSTRILKDFTHTFTSSAPCHIEGPNGSGKSSLLKIVAGFTTPDQGSVRWYYQNKQINASDVWSLLSFAAPYIDVPDEFTLSELLHFHTRFKPLRNNLNVNDLMDRAGLIKSKNKTVRSFSSGMKQRVKLGLATMADTPLLLLDEPVSNLDKTGKEFYANLIHDFGKDRLIIVCSNQIPEEHFFCIEKISLGI